MQIAIEELKQLGSRLIADFNKDREPLEEMKQAINYLDCIIKKEKQALRIQGLLNTFTMNSLEEYQKQLLRVFISRIKK